MTLRVHCAGARVFAAVPACFLQLKHSRRLVAPRAHGTARQSSKASVRWHVQEAQASEGGARRPTGSRRGVRCMAQPPPMRDAAGQPNTSQMLVFVPPHPLLKHWLAVARSSATPPQTFRSALAELGRLLIYEARPRTPRA